MSQYHAESPYAFSPGTTNLQQRAIFRIFLLLLGIYALDAGYAVFAQRHLYGDASWFLVKIMSTGSVTSFYTDFFHQFYYSRFVSYWLTQAPTVIALHLGVHGAQLLSWILGSTYFGLKLASLVICYKLLDDGKKLFVVFPLFGLFAGTINSDIYIVTETHVAVSFLWPIAILLTKHERIGPVAKYLGFFGILAASFTYESWAFFSPLLMVAGYLNARRLDGKQRSTIGAMSVLLLVPLCVNWAAILFPRDPTNEAGFVQGVISVFTGTLNHIATWHVTALASTLAVLLFALFMLAKREMLRATLYGWLLWPVVLILAIAPPLHFLMYHNGLVFGYSIVDRGFGGLAIQLILLVLYIGASGTKALDLRSAIKASASVLVALAVGQVASQILATRAWVHALDVTKATLATEHGSIPCSVIDRRSSSTGRVAPSTIMCSWWAYPMSVLFAKAGMVQSILAPPNLVFQPFNPLDAGSLPRFLYGGPDYAKYTATLGSSFTLHLGERASFTSGSEKVVMLRRGFSQPEPWATWTDGDVAKMHVCLENLAKMRSLRLTFEMIPFVTLSQPDRQISVVLPSGTAARWDFHYPDVKPGSRSLTISENDWPASGCGDITFHMLGAVRSPLELGMSGDPRKLGFALIAVSVTK